MMKNNVIKPRPTLKGKNVPVAPKACQHSAGQHQAQAKQNNWKCTAATDDDSGEEEVLSVEKSKKPLPKKAKTCATNVVEVVEDDKISGGEDEVEEVEEILGEKKDDEVHFMLYNVMNMLSLIS